MKKLISALALLALCGCTSVKYSRVEPQGETVTLSTVSFATKKAIAEVEYARSTNGVPTFRLKGYQNDQVEAIKAAVAAGADAAAKYFSGGLAK